MGTGEAQGYPICDALPPRLAQVGVIAINDGVVLETHIYLILRNYFRKDAFYADLLDLFLEVRVPLFSNNRLVGLDPSLPPPIPPPPHPV